jgi:hypothetical protein
MITPELPQQKAQQASGIERHFLTLAQQFMARQNMSGAAAVGSFVDLELKIPKAGERVLMPAGVEIRTTGEKGVFTSKRKQIVAVHRVNDGGLYGERGEVVEIPASIIWAGAGGYWCEVSVRDWASAAGMAG